MRPNARQSDNNIGWQRQAENCKRDDGPTRLAETSSILIAVVFIDGDTFLSHYYIISLGTLWLKQVDLLLAK